MRPERSPCGNSGRRRANFFDARHDPNPSLLRHPLSLLTLSSERAPKRARLIPDDRGAETIESRVESGFYDSVESLVDDVNSIATSFLDNTTLPRTQLSGDRLLSAATRRQISFVKETLSQLVRRSPQQPSDLPMVNGTASPTCPSSTRDKPTELVDNLTMTVDDGNGVIPKQGHGDRAVLTLITQTEKGPRQLWSGLQLSSDAGDYEPIDPKSLPNGISVTTASRISGESTERSQGHRTLGEVFKPHPSLKPPEPPRLSKNSVRGSTIGFANAYENSDSENVTPTFKNDYRFTPLPAGNFLQYSNAGSQSASEARRKKRTLSFGDGKGEHIADEDYDQAKAEALFRQVYSSFAPTCDNSSAIIPGQVRSEAYYNRIGHKRLKAQLSSNMRHRAEEAPSSTWTAAAETKPRDDFADLVANFVPEDNPLDCPQQVEADEKDVDIMLEEISEMLEELSSYQRNRNLSALSRPSKIDLSTPSSQESEKHEMLKNHLTTIIKSLPPFAVARLNGDQLEALDISTNLDVAAIDYVGTMASDEYTLQRKRTSAATTSAAVRASVGAPPAPGRPGLYQISGTSTPSSYNQRAYGTNISRTSFQQPFRNAVPSYTPTPTPSAPQAFQTPRPPPSAAQRPSYTQPTYQQGNSSAVYKAPNVQQFQRPMQNGYGSLGGQSNTPSQPAYAQRPSQPGYQQRAQDNYARSGSPQKAGMNGQGRMFQQTQQSLSTTANQYASTDPRASTSGSEQQGVIDRIKAAQPFLPRSDRQPPTGTPPMQRSNVPQQSVTPGAGRSINGAPMEIRADGQ